MRKLAHLASILLVAACCHVTQAQFLEDFDTTTNAYTLTNTSGGAPAVTTTPGPTGNFDRLTNLDGNNNNSIAFDEAASQTGPSPGGIKLAFDFRISDDAANAAAGGCCDSAADGLWDWLVFNSYVRNDRREQPGGRGCNLGAPGTPRRIRSWARYLSEHRCREPQLGRSPSSGGRCSTLLGP